MPLRVFMTDKESAHAPEAKAFYELSFVLKKVFDERGWNGVLLGNPIRKESPFAWADAILFEQSTIIILDFKHWGGVITLPDENSFTTGEWHSKNGNTYQVIKGGKNHNNPFDQLMDYRKDLKRMLKGIISFPSGCYIDAGVIFHDNNVDIDKAIVPGRYKNYFFVSKMSREIEDPDSYFVNILAMINSKSDNHGAFALTQSDFAAIHQLFESQHEIDTEDITSIFSDNGWSEEQARINKQLNSALDDVRRARNAEALAKRKVKEKDSELNKKAVALSKERAARYVSDEKARAAEKRAEIIAENYKSLQAEKEKLEKNYKRHEEMLKKTSDPKVVNQIKAQNEVILQKIDDINARLDSEKSNTSIKETKRPLLLFTIGALALLLTGVLIFAVLNIKIHNGTPNAELSVEMPSRPDSLEGPYKAYVIDGDTISVYINGQKTNVRLIGIEAPEAKNAYNEKSDCYGDKAKSFLIDRIGGKEVYLEADPSQDDTDSYDRLLRYVWLGDELVNQSLLIEGNAREYTYRVEYRYRDYFTKAQKYAHDNLAGLWGACTQ
ncbi:MAG: thermonuclease family protein [Candidatus Saccharibacteria bacterium]|nr:thermonuclease family protein [Candidatus Saccharibacteria bacterium]